MSSLLHARTILTGVERTPDFLIRLSVKRLPFPQTGSKRLGYTLVPDGLQHPKFKGLDDRRGHYVVCRRAAIQELGSKGTASLTPSINWR
jgi:hypothetical protein